MDFGVVSFNVGDTAVRFFAMGEGELVGFAVGADEKAEHPPMSWYRGRLSSVPKCLLAHRDTVRWILETWEHLGDSAPSLLSKYNLQVAEGRQAVCATLSLMKWGKICLGFSPLQVSEQGQFELPSGMRTDDDPVLAVMAVMGAPTRGALLRITEYYQLGAGLIVDSCIPTDADGPWFRLEANGGFDPESQRLASMHLSALAYWFLRAGNVRIRWNEERRRRRRHKSDEPELTATVEEMVGDHQETLPA